MLIIGTLSIVKNPTTNVINQVESSTPAITKEKDQYEFARLRDPHTGEIPKNIRAKELKFIEDRFKVNFRNKDNNKLRSTSPWQRRGPFEIGGRTRSFDCDIRNESILIAGGVSSGMWKSNDGGSTWIKTSNPAQLHSVSCLAQDKRPGKENIWYYGTGEYWGNSAAISGDGIFKSSNNGDSWNILQSTSTSRPDSWDNSFDYIWNIAIDNSAPLDQDILYVATVNSGIIRTTNGGQNWVKVLGGSSSSRFSDIAITKSGIKYAALSWNNSNQKGIYRSIDGVKWTNITPQNFPGNYRRIVIGIAPSDENQVYFVAESPGYGKLTFNHLNDSLYHSFWKYTYQSGDGNGDGGIWEDRSQNLPKPEPTRGQMNSQTGYNLVLKVKPDDPEVVFLGAVALYRSNNGFKTPEFAWIGGTCPDNTCDYDYRYTNHHSDIHALFFSNNNPNVLYTGSDGGIHKTLDDMSNNVNWISLNNGYFTTQFYTVAISHGAENSPKILGGLQDNGTLLSRNHNLNEEWTNPLRADGFYCQVPDGAGFYYASQNGTWQPKIKIYRIYQDENGENITQTRIDPAGGKDFIWNTPFLLDPNNNDIMYVAGGKMVWRNNNLSLIPNINSNDSTSIGWDSLSKSSIAFNADGSPTESQNNITALGISKNPANVLYYGTSRGKIYKISNANTGNPNVLAINAQNLPQNSYVSSFAVNPDDADKVLVSFSNYGVLSIFYTEDGGNSWKPVSGNLEENPYGNGAGPAVNWVEILKYNDKYVYFAGTSAGLFSTTFLNGTNTAWQMEGVDEIGSVVIDMLDARHSDRFIAVGTHGLGSFSTYYEGLPKAPAATQLVSPFNGIKYITNEINLSWQPSSDAIFYDVQISLDPNFVKDVITLDGITSTSAKFSPVEQGKRTYSWRVRTINAGGASEFTEAWQFTSALANPELTYPENNTFDMPTNFTLKWTNVEGATAYRLQVAQGFNIANTFIDTVINSNQFDIENLASNKSHVWRVAAIEDGNEGLFSGTSRFVTKNAVSVGTNNRTIFTAQILPNPVNSNSKIRLEILQSGNTTIRIYDVKGNLVEIAFAGILNEGIYDFRLPLINLYPGYYFVYVNSGNVKKVLKFLYAK